MTIDAKRGSTNGGHRTMDVQLAAKLSFVFYSVRTFSSILSSPIKVISLGSIYPFVLNCCFILYIGSFLRCALNNLRRGDVTSL